MVTYHIVPKVGSCIGDTAHFAVTVTPGDSVKLSISASANNICSGTQVTFTATPTNPGANPNYDWKVNGISQSVNSTTFNYTPNNNDIVNCILTSSLTVCISNNPATSNSITMVVDPLLPVSVTVTASSKPLLRREHDHIHGASCQWGTSPHYQWKVNGITGGTDSVNYSYIPTNGDLITCTLASSELCTSTNPASSIPYPAPVTPRSAVSVSISASSNPFCLGSSVTFTASPTNGGLTPSYQWFVNGIPQASVNSIFTYFPLNGDLVYCTLTSSEPCTTNNPASSIQLQMIENTGLPAGVTVTASSNPFCPGSSVTFTATPINGGTNPAFQWKVNGFDVGTNLTTYTDNPMTNDSIRRPLMYVAPIDFALS